MFTLLNLKEIEHDIPQAHVILNRVCYYIYIKTIKYEPEAKMVVGKIKIVTDDGEVIVESEEYAPTVIAIIDDKRFIVTFDGDVAASKKKEPQVESYRFDVMIDDSTLYYYPLRWKQWQVYLATKNN